MKLLDVDPFGHPSYSPTAGPAPSWSCSSPIARRIQWAFFLHAPRVGSLAVSRYNPTAKCEARSHGGLSSATHRGTEPRKPRTYHPVVRLNMFSSQHD